MRGHFGDVRLLGLTVRGCAVRGEKGHVVRSTLAGVGMVVVMLACAASADPAHRVTVTCGRTRLAVINHVSVCLTAGTKCKSAFLRQYERHSFYCWVGVLARQVKAPVITRVPSAPANAPTPPPGTVDFTVNTHGDPSSIVAAPYPIPGCSSASVTDLSNNKNLGPGTRAEFSGVKEFTCADGGTINSG